MSDIFISYARQDRGRAEQLAKALEAQRWTVWWDPQITPGKKWAQVIEKQLKMARCVIVLWSKQSVESDWVNTEAADGKQRNILVPALIEDVEIPLEFRRIEAARLVDWRPTESNSEFELLLKGVRQILEMPEAAKVAVTSQPSSSETKRGGKAQREHRLFGRRGVPEESFARRLILIVAFAGLPTVGLVFAIQEFVGYESTVLWVAVSLGLGSAGAVVGTTSYRAGMRQSMIFGWTTCLAYLVLVLVPFLPYLIPLVVFPLFVAPAWGILAVQGYPKT